MLFVIALAAGAGRDEGDPAHPSGVVDALKGLQSGQFLEIGKGATTTCGSSGDTLSFADGCAIHIDARGRFSGPTRAVFASTTATVRVTMKPADGPELDMKVKPNKCAETAVDRKGGDLVLLCLSMSCSVDVLHAGCRH